MSFFYRKTDKNQYEFFLNQRDKEIVMILEEPELCHEVSALEICVGLNKAYELGRETSKSS